VQNKQHVREKNLSNVWRYLLTKKNLSFSAHLK